MKTYYLKIADINMKHFVLLLIGVFSFLACSAQGAKRKVSPEDYNNWGTLTGETISDDGKWVSFKMQYLSGNDTLFIADTKNAYQKAFPKASSVTFSPDSKYAAIKRVNSLVILDLTSNSERLYDDISSFYLLPMGHIVLLSGGRDNGELKLIGHEGQVLWSVSGAKEFTVSTKGLLAVTAPDGLMIIDTSKKDFIPITIPATKAAERMQWSKPGNCIVFFCQPAKDTDSIRLCYYSLKEKKLFSIYNKKLNFEDSYRLQGYSIALSEDERQVFFFIIADKEKIVEENLVEIWNTETIMEYPQAEFYSNPENNELLTLWDIPSGKIVRLDHDDFINAKILPGGNYTLVQSKASITSITEEIAPADYYAVNLNDNTRQLVVSQGSRSAGAIHISPSGQYISFFKDGDYFAFNTKTSQVVNLTASTGINFYDREFDNAGTNPGYSSPGWTHDSQFVVLYDQYDIWLFSPDGKRFKRITQGREARTRYRVILDKNEPRNGNLSQYAMANINLRKGIILSELRFDKKSAYYIYNTKEGLVQIESGAAKFNHIIKARDAGAYLYIKETEAIPRQLKFSDNVLQKQQVIYQSNRHYNQYEWYHSELISYKNAEGVPLQGVLLYPAGYQPGKRYPMIVHFYERMSSRLFEYYNPVERDPIGFTPSNYLLDGYLVLLPDIVYEVGNPGLSATDCITAAVNEVKSRGIVEKNHIGLVGHSFAGYQTSFVITQTNIFGAAVAGAGVTDFTSSYLTMNYDRRRSDAWRFESQQFRMNTSPFDDWEGYTRNSPVAHAAKIETPLLSWAGKNDTSVDFEQSIELHLALRRLHKPGVMLLYPGQNHILTDPKAQLHLTKAIKYWLDSHLKD